MPAHAPSTNHRGSRALALHQRGFTLIELIVTLVVATVVMGFTAMFIGTPIQAYLAQARRATLSDSAEAITRNIALDVRTALPNSTRTLSNSTFFALEMLTAGNVLRYRAAGEGPGPDDELNVGAGISDNKFAMLGQAAQPAYFAVVNPNITPSDVYTRTGVMAPGAAATVTFNAGTNETRVTLAAPFNFYVPTAPIESPSHSVFLVSGPVTYICDANSGTLRKYAGYAIDPVHTARDSDAELMTAGATRSLIATNVAGCEATRSAATKWHGDLVSFRVTLSNNGDNLPVFYQAQVERRP